MKFQTTLNIIRAHHPCADGWAKLLKHLGKTEADNAPLDFATILESNGLDDALWALRAVLPEHEKDRDREARLLAADYAESVLPFFEQEYPADKRPREAIDATRRFVRGEITESDLTAARDAVGDALTAAWDAAGDAVAAAWVARDARDAAGDAEKSKQTEQFKRRFCQP